MTDEQLILAAGALMTAALAASLLAARMRVPSLVLFLGIGIVMGSDVTGWVSLEDYELARTIGTIALALILFEGGLSAGFDEIRPVLVPATVLATVGTLLTAVVTGLAAAWLFDLSVLEGLLLGSVLSATDSAAVFGLLRGSTLRRRIARTLEAESGLNDPIGVLLVLGFIEWLQQPDYGVADMLELFFRQLGIGLAVGIAVGAGGARAARKIPLPTAGLYPVASLATAAVAFGLAGSLEGSGFMAVYLAGLVLGSSHIPARRTVGAFHEGLGWVAQLGLFLTLGLLVFPSQLGDVAVRGTVLAIVLALVARPLAATVSTAPFGFALREQLLLGWAGMRGAVPVVLAIFPVIAGVEDSLDFFNIVFFAVVLSTLVQGATFEPVARRLGLTTNEPALPRPLSESGTIRRLGAEVLEYPVGHDDAIIGVRVRDLGLPRDAVINVIVRAGEAIPPRGSTRISAADELHVLLRQESADEVRSIVARWRAGPVGPPVRPRALPSGRNPIFSSWRWAEADGDAARPVSIRGQPVVERLRVRRDRAGGLFVLADGRYAVSGPLGAIGARGDVTAWARRRMREASSDERAWLQTVVGALAADVQP